jgi:hypothetical protein
MPEFDHGFKIIAHTSGRQLAELAGVPCTRWEPMTSEVQTVERLADRAFLAAHGRERFVVYFEAYTYWDAAAPWSVLAKSGLLSERERLPTKCLVFVLHPRGYQPQRGRFRLAVGGRTTQLVSLTEVCLWKKRPQPWWEQAPAVMTLYPLCRHGQPPPEALIHAAGVIERRESDAVRRADLLTILSVFGKLAYPDIDPKEIIGRQKMKESPFYQEIMDEGRVEKGRAYILAVLQERFGPRAAAAIAPAVNAVTDVPQLDLLHRLAIRCSGLDEFREALPAADEGTARPKRRRGPGGK